MILFHNSLASFLIKSDVSILTLTFLYKKWQHNCSHSHTTMPPFVIIFRLYIRRSSDLYLGRIPVLPSRGFTNDRLSPTDSILDTHGIWVLYIIRCG